MTAIGRFAWPAVLSFFAYAQPGQARAACAGTCLVCADLAAGRPEKAVKALDEIVLAEPVCSRAYEFRAVSKKRLDDAAGAALDYRESLKTPKEPGRAAAGGEDCACAGALKDEIGRLAENYRRGEEAKKEGIQLFLDGKADSALSKLDAAVSHDPSDPESRLSRAVILEKTGKDAGRVLDDYQDASRFALVAGRWDMAADALIAGAKLKGVDDRKMLPLAVTGLKALMEAAPADWNKREQVSAELKTLEVRMAEVFPAEAKNEAVPAGKKEGVVAKEKLQPNDPRPDGEDKAVADIQVPDLKEPETKQPSQPAPVMMKPPPHEED